MMHQLRLVILILSFIVFSSFNHAQTTHIIEVTDFVFTPADLTVIVGDTVRWMNLQGNHNVVADDNSFTSGPPSTANWVYDKVFTSVSVNPYYCELHGGPGSSGMSGVVTVENPVSVNGNGQNLFTYTLEQNFPNPFNPSTKIKYQLAAESFVSLRVYNITGSEVATLVQKKQTEGNYEVNFNAANLPSGFYIYQLNTGSFVQSRKMILLK